MTAGTRSRPASRPSVDPRIRARRIQVRRQQGRRRLRVLVGLVVLAAVAGLVVAAAFSALFDVDSIEVTGAERTSTDEVVAASGIEPGEPLVLVDTGAAAERIGRLPWVASASVRRSVTGTVTVEVSERTPVAVLPASDGGWMAVDGDGRQLVAVPPPGPDELLVVGVEASGVAGEPVGVGAQSVLRLLEALTPAVRAEISGLGIDGSELVLDLLRGGRVRLGEPADLDEKLVSLETMLARVDLRCLAELDLGVPSAPALTRVPPADGDPDDPLSDLSKCP
jgi:cell division protein FtsQ